MLIEKPLVIAAWAMGVTLVAAEAFTALSRGSATPGPKFAAGVLIGSAAIHLAMLAAQMYASRWWRATWAGTWLVAAVALAGAASLVALHATGTSQALSAVGAAVPIGAYVVGLWQAWRPR